MRKEVGFMVFGTGVFLNIRTGVAVALRSAFSLAGMTWFIAWLCGTPITRRLIGAAALWGLVVGPVSILLHELAHAKTAWRLYQVPTQILIRPNNMVTDFLFRDQVLHPRGRFVVALAGPLATVGMALIAAVIATGSHSDTTEAIGWSVAILLALICDACLRGRDGKICRGMLRKMRQVKT